MFFWLPAVIGDIDAETPRAAQAAGSRTPGVPQEVPPPSDPLTLGEVLQAVDASFPKLAGARAEREAAVAKRREKRGAFDVTTGVGTDFLRYNSSSTRGKEYTYTATAATVETTLRSGVKLIAGRDLNNGVVKSPLSSTGSEGTFFVGAKIPLLRGLGINEKAVGERQAILGIPLADRNIDSVRLSALLSASAAYWDWVSAGQKRTVASDLLRLAELRAVQIRRENELRAQPNIAVVEADQEVQRRRGALVKAERDLQKAAFKLAVYLWNDDGTPGAVPPVNRLPATMPIPAPLTNEETDTARSRAVTERPEIRAVTIQQQITGLEESLAQNDSKPDLSFVVQPGQDVGRLGIGDTMKAGIAFSVPLNRWEATGRRDAARAKLSKLTQDQELLRRQVALEVEDAASAVNTAEERYRAAVQEVDLAVRLEEGERIRFRAGDSTLFLVNQRERSTAEARARLIDVMAEYQQAIAAFKAAS
ncbi:MAG: TolC family protein, partial [Armatimonadota bacterium]